ncbi:MAG: hypothetical protein ABIF01_02505 [Candidatus Micrarchaeota archaeon]
MGVYLAGKSGCVPITRFLAAAVLGGAVNSILSFVGFLICMPCMLSDAAGSYLAISYLTRGAKAKITRSNALMVGALAGLLGSIGLVLMLLVIFLLVQGGLVDMASSTEELIESISGTISIPSWLVVVAGFLIILFKILVSALVATGVSTFE